MESCSYTLINAMKSFNTIIISDLYIRIKNRFHFYFLIQREGKKPIFVVEIRYNQPSSTI